MSKNDLEKAKEQLVKGNHACVIWRSDRVLTSDSPGIKRLLDWFLEDTTVFQGAVAADRVIGLAAASVLVYGGIASIYASLISEPAVELLHREGIPFTYEKSVPHIMNVAKTDLCPMEKTCLGLNSPQEAFEALKNKIYP